MPEQGIPRVSRRSSVSTVILPSLIDRPSLHSHRCRPSSRIADLARVVDLGNWPRRSYCREAARSGGNRRPTLGGWRRGGALARGCFRKQRCAADCRTGRSAFSGGIPIRLRRPFGVGQITRITQATSIRGPAVLGCPHPGAPPERIKLLTRNHSRFI